MKLLAAALVILTASHTAKLVTEGHPGQQARSAHMPSESRPTPQQGEWFSHAIDDILRGE